MQVSHAILTVMFVISLVLAEDNQNKYSHHSIRKDQVALKRPRREQRKVLGFFTNKIAESPVLKEKYDEATKRIQSFVETIKAHIGEDIPSRPNLEAVLDTEGPNNESEKNVNALESIKGPLLSSVKADSLADNLDDKTGQPPNIEAVLDTEGPNNESEKNLNALEAIKGSLLSSVKADSLADNLDDETGKPPNIEGVLDREGPNNESEKNLNALESIKGPLISSVKADSLAGTLDDETGNNINTKNTLVQPETLKGSLFSSVEHLDHEITVHTSSIEKSLGESKPVEVSLVSSSKAEPKPDDNGDKIVADDSEKEVDSENLDVEIADLANTDDTESMKNELVSYEKDPNGIQSDVEILVYARTLVYSVTSLFVNVLTGVLSLVFIIIRLILPFPLNLLFGWIIGIFVD